MSATDDNTPDSQRPFFERSRTAKGLFIGLVVVCCALTVADFLHHKHGHFDFETWPVFHGVFGFLAYLTIVTAARGLRRLVKRPENYYDPEDPASALAPGESGQDAKPQAGESNHG